MKASEPENTPQIDMSMHQLRLFIGSTIFGIFFLHNYFIFAIEKTLQNSFERHSAHCFLFRMIVYVMRNQNTLIVHIVSS